MTQGAHADHSLWAIPPEALQEWLRLAAELDAAGTVPCRTSDPDAWWSDHPDGYEARMALDACSVCPARVACRDYALAADERFGIWGMTTPQQRRRRRREAIAWSQFSA